MDEYTPEKVADLIALGRRCNGVNVVRHLTDALKAEHQRAEELQDDIEYKQSVRLYAEHAERVERERDKALDGLFRVVKALGFDTDSAAGADEFFGPQTYCIEDARYTDAWDIAVAYAADYRTEMEETEERLEAERDEALAVIADIRDTAEHELDRIFDPSGRAAYKHILSRITDKEQGP